MPIKYPDIPAEDVWFREHFNNFQFLADNGATVIGSPSIANGIMSFNGTTDAVNIDNVYSNLNFASSTTGSIVAWVVTSDITQTQEIVSFGDTNADTRIQFDINNNGELRALAGVGGTTQWAVDTDSAVFVNNVPNQVALVQDGTEPVLYVNGSAPAQTFSTSTDKTYWFSQMSGLDNARIGCGNWNNGGNATFFVGNMNGIDLYNKALTAGEVDDIFTEQTFGEVKIDQLEFFLALRSHHNTGGVELTNNTGIIGDDTIRWGDGSASGTFPTLLVNNGASFDGGDYIYVNNALSLTNTNSFALGCLFKTSNSGTMFLIDVRESGPEGIAIELVSGAIRAFTDSDSAGQRVDTSGTYNDDQWHSCIVSFSESSGSSLIEIYIDGVLENSGTVNIFTTATGAKPVVGADYLFANFYTGDMKFPFFWRFRLTPTQAAWQHFKLFRELNV